MRWSLLSAFLLSLSPVGVFGQSSTVDAYFAFETPIAKANLLANIGADGSSAHNAKPGIVIASPSTSDPDYLYTWTRDAALVFRTLIDQFTLGQDDTLSPLINEYIAAQTILQQVSNPSGTVSTGGLGEPKFNIDMTAFTGSWGRPQRDGPALRAIALITWANSLNTSQANDLWPILKLDLDYVALHWNETTFDLWEEVSSSSFFTTAVQHRALRQGATLAYALGQIDSFSTYSTQADNTLCFLQSYWNPSGYMTANTGGGRTGKDANTVLASIHTFDPLAGCDSVTFQPCSDRALLSLLSYVQSFDIYAINNGIPSNQGSATGRYSEDVYYNGNPWYLTTLAVAEQLYDALIVWNTTGSLTVTSVSLPFFTNLVPNTTEGTYLSYTNTYAVLTAAVRAYADSFVSVVAKYTPADGSLAEQFTRTDGTPTSARDLTWSYAALLTANNARNGVVPASWGAAGLEVPARCVGGIKIPTTFVINATTVLGENIHITGSVPALQNWSPTDALLLSDDAYPTWTITVALPANAVIEYKYLRNNNGQITWESDPNHKITTPSTGLYTIFDQWH
ncbi:hypothetical protein C0992_004697 [Termitomyces sp. T32_za158]|nr:hypothetical protein C0992_004697 [Termitomyces sp. T32_za158]